MASRLQLQNDLEQILKTRNVYFQPPETLKLKFPCIIYELNNVDFDYASNKTYTKKKKYTITYVDNDPDNSLYETILTSFQYASFDRVYTSNNLYHYVITIFY